MTSIDRDERTIAVENASYKWGYLVLMFGLLTIVAYRALARDESSWDLLALVGLAGLVTAAYQKRGLVLTRRWLLDGAVALALGVVIALVIALVMVRRR
jgi:hypothetical protein